VKVYVSMRLPVPCHPGGLQRPQCVIFCVFVFVYVFLCVCMYMYLCVSAFLRVSFRVYVMYVYSYACACVWIGTCLYAHTNSYACVCIWICTCVYSNANIPTRSRPTRKHFLWQGDNAFCEFRLQRILRSTLIHCWIYGNQSLLI